MLLLGSSGKWWALMTEEYILQDSGDVVPSPEITDFAYIVGSDGSGYSVYLSDSRLLMETALDEYTVTEGLIFTLFITVWLICVVKFLGWCFKWMK